jgi:hypothetical protein
VSQAKDQLQSQVTSGIQLISESLKTVINSEKYDHQVGDVADNVNLDMSVNASALEFNLSDLDAIVSHQISAQIPDGYSLTGQIRHEFTLKTLKDKQAVLRLNISASLIPDLDTDALTKSIMGKSVSAAKATLENIPGVTQINFKFSPHLPIQLLTLPHQLRNIGIVIGT